MYYVITFLGIFDPHSPLPAHFFPIFTTENKQKMPFSGPPPPLLPVSDYVIQG